MRRSASEVIKNLERRIARLEGKTASTDYDREVFVEYAGGFIMATLKLIKQAAREVESDELILVQFYLNEALAIVSIHGEARDSSGLMGYRNKTPRFSAYNLALGITSHGGHNEKLLARLLEEEIRLGLPRGLEEWQVRFEVW